MAINMMKWLLLILSFSALSFGSIRLNNDSPSKLRAVIRAADGTYLGEMVILPGHFNTWSTDYPSFGPGGTNYEKQPSWSQTPYTVTWHCLDGGLFGVVDDVSPGALVTAGSSNGPRYCKPEEKGKNKQDPYGAKPGDEQLQDQNEAATPPQN